MRCPQVSTPSLQTVFRRSPGLRRIFGVFARAMGPHSTHSRRCIHMSPCRRLLTAYASGTATERAQFPNCNTPKSFTHHANTSCLLMLFFFGRGRRQEPSVIFFSQRQNKALPFLLSVARNKATTLARVCPAKVLSRCVHHFQGNLLCLVLLQQQQVAQAFSSMAGWGWVTCSPHGRKGLYALGHSFSGRLSSSR